MVRGKSTESSTINLMHVKPKNTEIKPAEAVDQGDRLSLCTKLCYAIGGIPYQITGSILCLFLQIYLLDVAQLDPSFASIILFVGQAWDAITDPTVGFLVSRSRWTRIGRMMPWIIFSTPFAVLTYFLIWFVLPIEQGKFVWCLMFYFLFQSMQTCFHVPYSALTMFITSDQKERDSATAYRMMVEVLGSLLGTVIQGQIVGGSSNCPTEDGFPESRNISSIQVEQTRKSYMVASGVVCTIYVVCAAVLFLGVSEKKGRDHQNPLTFCQGLCLVMSHKPYVKLVIGFLFTCLAFMLLQGNLVLFITYTLGYRNEVQNLLLTVMLSATLSVPGWQWFLTRCGKKMTIYYGMSLVIPFLIIMVSTKLYLTACYLISVGAGLSVGAAFFLPWSMLPDAVDDFKVQNPDRHGHEALFYSYYVFFIKFSTGISLGISTLSLKFAGYVTGSCSQPELVGFTLKMLISPLPVFLIIVGLLIIRTYPVDEKRRRSNNRILQDRLNNESKPESSAAAIKVAVDDDPTVTN
ncbi:sodium-dependent lysophosphatidylcholine symporter 1-B-like [Solea senegalensis]|uniref:Sodium-dependent lysophosphatidylcholine symporter 1-B-like n=2 Tax=Solea senegalensis TaxID=28829 RepID=A0AAV6S095_SOLSE|nr:sodium-dependent lysophosphatidylcholine symporter 1-B-like [Solea senegalensis]KAG7511308.1 sodium-dependent lysophosphatidylcholine symporter 1-B-like [Solea senegalensis]